MPASCNMRWNAYWSNSIFVGHMHGLYTTDVVWNVPIYGREEKMGDVYRKHETIYRKINLKHHVSKYEMILQFSIPFFFRPIRYSGVKFYAMLSFFPLNRVYWTSGIKNPHTNVAMLPTPDLIEFSHQLVRGPGLRSLPMHERAINFICYLRFSRWRHCTKSDMLLALLILNILWSGNSRESMAPNRKNMCQLVSRQISIQRFNVQMKFSLFLTPVRFENKQGDHPKIFEN